MLMILHNCTDTGIQKLFCKDTMQLSMWSQPPSGHIEQVTNEFWFSQPLVPIKIKGKDLLSELPMHYNCKCYASACKASLTGRWHQPGLSGNWAPSLTSEVRHFSHPTTWAYIPIGLLIRSHLPPHKTYRCWKHLGGRVCFESTSLGSCVASN